MQFHLNGFTPGDPKQTPQTEQSRRESDDTLDVLIIGSGPAGLTLAAYLSNFPSINTRIVERKSAALKMGQADGIACRSVEMFEAFGFADKVLQEAYWVSETSFWRPAGDGVITRHNRIQDVEDGISEFPHLILSQARIHDFYLQHMRNSATGLDVDYNLSMSKLEIDANNESYPVTVTLENTSTPCEIETVKAKYVVGCDGAHSAVRKALAIKLHGDSANKAWGVMDVLASTDFPDIRLKCAIQSADAGSVLIIPREGGYLVRLYIEFDELDTNERVANREITSDDIIAKAQKIFHPYTLNVHDIVWWSVYEIGQRLCHSFDNVPADHRDVQNPCVFIAGDACHTHSPKAGQGMNVSMADAFNLGWKLSSVLLNRSHPKLLQTYSEERQEKAQELIDHDRDMARLISARDTEADTFQKFFIKHGRFTAGVETHYSTSLITTAPTNQSLATGYSIGKRFQSVPVIRLGDAKPMELAHTIKADGRWRLFVFSDQCAPEEKDSPLNRLCQYLMGDTSPIKIYTPAAADIDSVIDVRAVFQQKHTDVALEKLHPLLLPKKGRLGLTDYEKVFCPDFKNNKDVFEIRGVDRGKGCIVVVRPDQHVATIVGLEAHAKLAEFFEQFMAPHSSAL